MKKVKSIDDTFKSHLRSIQTKASRVRSLKDVENMNKKSYSKLSKVMNTDKNLKELNKNVAYITLNGDDSNVVANSLYNFCVESNKEFKLPLEKEMLSKAIKDTTKDAMTINSLLTPHTAPISAIKETLLKNKTPKNREALDSIIEVEKSLFDVKNAINASLVCNSVLKMNMNSIKREMKLAGFKEERGILFIELIEDFSKRLLSTIKDALSYNTNNMSKNPFIGLIQRIFYLILSIFTILTTIFTPIIAIASMDYFAGASVIASLLKFFTITFSSFIFPVFMTVLTITAAICFFNTLVDHLQHIKIFIFKTIVFVFKVCIGMFKSLGYLVHAFIGSLPWLKEFASGVIEFFDNLWEEFKDLVGRDEIIEEVVKTKKSKKKEPKLKLKETKKDSVVLEKNNEEEQAETNDELFSELKGIDLFKIVKNQNRAASYYLF